jgi:uncharacterized protein YdeI (BOF family)
VVAIVMDNNDANEVGFEDSDLRSRSVRLSSMRKMPEVPDMSGKLVTQRRGDPFVLSDWGGSNAYKGTKP